MITLIQSDLYRVARARLDVEDDICDAIQETMIMGYQHLKDLREIRYFKSWIIKILINECNKIYKQRNRQIIIFNKSVEKSAITESEDSINDANDKIDFENILKSLSYDDRLLITLYYNSQFSAKEIAELLNTNVNTVKSRLLRSKMKIKEIYKEELSNG